MIKAIQALSICFAIMGSIGCASLGGGSMSPAMPEFPWPPPETSAKMNLPDEFFRTSQEGLVLLRDVDNRLSGALRSAGYFEKSYHAVPRGFALVARLEQINPDGTPKSGTDRWAVDVGPLRKIDLSLDSYLRALFTSNPGFFRVIVFVVTPDPFSESKVVVSVSEAKAWLHTGLNRLPDYIGRQKYTRQYGCSALIYEFEKERGKDAERKVTARIDVKTHLEKANLWNALER